MIEGMSPNRPIRALASFTGSKHSCTREYCIPLPRLINPSMIRANCSFLDEQIAVVNSQAGELLVRTLNVQQQATKGDVHLDVLALAFFKAVHFAVADVVEHVC